MTSKTKAPVVTLGLLVTERREDGYYHVSATVVTIGPNTWEQNYRAERAARGAADDSYQRITNETIRNVGDERLRGLYLENVVATSMGVDKDAPRRLFGFELRYQNVYTIDTDKATSMASTLKTTSARLDKLRAKYGEPTTFGQFLGRVAEAIGATVIVRPQGRERGWSYSENEYRHLSIADGIYHVDNLVRAWETERERASSGELPQAVNG